MSGRHVRRAKRHWESNPRSCNDGSNDHNVIDTIGPGGVATQFNVSGDLNGPWV